MQRLRLHHLSRSSEEIALERKLEFAALYDTEKFRRWLILMNTARLFNAGRPFKEPQGKGFVLRKVAPVLPFLFCIGMSVHAQKPGSYSTRTPLFGESVKIIGDTSFEYSTYSCTGSTLGKGKIKTENHHLTLTFEEIAADSQASSSRIKMVADLADSLIVHLTAKDEQQDQPLINAIVLVANLKDTLIKSVSDFEGRALINTSAQKTNSNLTVYYFGSAYSMNLPLRGAYQVDISLHQKLYDPILAGTVYKYAFRQTGRNLKLKSLGGNRWRTFYRNED